MGLICKWDIVQLTGNRYHFKQTNRRYRMNTDLYDVEWVEDDTNCQETGLTDAESMELLRELSGRGIFGTRTIR